MTALALASHSATKLVPHIKPATLFFFSDNIAAVQKIVDLKPHPAQSSSILFRRAIDQLLTNHPNLNVEICWIPGHKGITGNERADKLAHEAGSLVPEPFFNRTITWAKARAKNRAIKTWCAKWKSERHSDTVTQHLPYPPRWHLHPFHQQYIAQRGYSRATHCRLFQVILGHAFYGEFYPRFIGKKKKTEDPPDPSCPCDNTTSQSISHILIECPLHNDARIALRKASRFLCIADLFISILGLQAVVTFLSRSNAFRKLT
ncbi:hypothetical protein FRC09_003495 [Ceratobasidium sp. 395]|nr:hypothetical protein FRC09_003495 [Ceratobasidium sp. 395]